MIILKYFEDFEKPKILVPCDFSEFLRVPISKVTCQKFAIGHFKALLDPQGAPLELKSLLVPKTKSFSKNLIFRLIFQPLQVQRHPHHILHMAKGLSNNSFMKRSVHTVPYQLSKYTIVTLCHVNF